MRRTTCSLRRWRLQAITFMVPVLLGGCSSELDDPFKSDAELELEDEDSSTELPVEDSPSGVSRSLGAQSTPVPVHPLRQCYKDSQCYSNQCWCINNICTPQGVGPLPPQEYCSYPPDFLSGDYVSCENSGDCANHCLCYTAGTYGNYCKPFGVGPHPPLSSCEPDGGDGGGGDGVGDGGEGGILD